MSEQKTRPAIATGIVSVPTGNKLIDYGLGVGQGIGNLLTGGYPMEVRDLWFHDQVVHLDGYRFINCRFDRCRMHLNSTVFGLQSCYIDPTTLVQYGQDAMRPIKLFLSRYEWAYQLFPDFAPAREAGGTLSIA